MRLPVFVLLFVPLAGCGESHHLDAEVDARSDVGDVGDARLDAGADARDVGIDTRDSMVDDAGPDTFDACIPDCHERECGPDFCGGLCDDTVCSPGEESFEGFVAIGDSVRSLDPPTLFPSGLLITEPNPNPRGTPDARIADCAALRGYLGFTCDSDSDTIPDGSAFLGYAWWMEPLELRLPVSATTVRFHVANTGTTDSWPVQLRLLNESGEQIDEMAVLVGTPVEITSPSSNIRVLHFTRDADIVGALLLDLVSWE